MAIKINISGLAQTKPNIGPYSKMCKDMLQSGYGKLDSP